MKSAPRSPARPAGIVATTTNHAIRSSGVSMRRRADGPEPRADEAHEVAPEVRADRDERSEVQRDVERLVEAVVLLEVRPLGRPGNEDEVARRRDRQELGEPLHDAEDERLAVRERRRVVPHSEEREDDGETERGPRDAEHDGAAHGEILRSCPPTRSETKGAQIAAIR